MYMHVGTYLYICMNGTYQPIGRLFREVSRVSLSVAESWKPLALAEASLTNYNTKHYLPQFKLINDY